MYALHSIEFMSFQSFRDNFEKSAYGKSQDCRLLVGREASYYQKANQFHNIAFES